MNPSNSDQEDGLDDLAVLKEIRDRLAQFELVHCGMAHEKIRRESCGQLPVLDPIADHGFARTNYCSSELRMNRLACAHTMARQTFSELLDALPASAVPSAQIQNWKSQLQELDQNIVLVDWQKSDEELVHARHSAELSEPGSVPIDITKANLAQSETRLQKQIKTHNGYVDRLRDLQSEIVNAIQDAMTR